jgi:class 3 adenylate cyclase
VTRCIAQRPDCLRAADHNVSVGGSSVGVCGESVMLTPAHSTLVCPVLFLDLVAYSKKSIGEQTLAKHWLNAAILTAVHDVGPTDRIIRDTGDGLAVSFFRDAECALMVGLQLSSSLGNVGPNGDSIEARIGINLGPVRLVQDVNGQTNIIGDGINAAQRVMSFACPGQVLVSRSYYSLLVGTSECYAGLFAYQGLRVDKHSREHEIYSVIATPGDLQKARNRTALAMPPAGAASPRVARNEWYVRAVEACRWIGMRRQGYAGVLLFTFLAAAAALHSTDWREHRDANATTTSSHATRVGIAPPTTPPPSPQGAESPTPLASSHAAGKRATARPNSVVAGVRMTQTYIENKVARPRMASVQLAISPWGEVRVNGRTVGVSPPLSRLELAPGAHRIEITNAELRPYMQTLLLEPSQTIKLKHKFAEELGRGASLSWPARVVPPG